MNDEFEHYTALGLFPGASQVQVRAQFRLLAKRLHPDVHGGDAHHQEQFRRIHDAYEFLTDPERKAAYDAQMPKGHPQPASEADALPSGTQGSLWVHAGATTPVPFMAVGPRPRSTHRRRSVALGRKAHDRLTTMLTWALTAATLSFFGVMLRAPRADATQPLTATRATEQRSVVSGTTSPIADAAPGDQGISISAPENPMAEHYYAWTPPLMSRDVTPEPRIDPQYEIDPKYMVDSKYTSIGSHDTAVDPTYKTVDPRAGSIDARITAIDSQYTSIDPKLVSP